MTLVAKNKLLFKKIYSIFNTKPMSMNFIITLKSIAFLSFFSFLFNTADIPSTHNENCVEEAALTYTHKICQFQATLMPPPGVSCGTLSGGSTSYHLVVDSNCKATLQGKLYVSNLHPNPVLNDDYFLPPGTEDIFVSYSSVDGQGGGGGYDRIFGPVKVFTFTGNVANTASGPMPLFEADILLDFGRVGPVCASQHTQMNGGYINALVDIMVSDNDGLMYDVDQYSSNTDIFSCQVFRETCTSCPSSCYHTTDVEPIYSGYVCGSCGPCGGNGGNTPIHNSSVHDLTSEKNESSSFTIDNKASKKQTFKIVPNPFNNFIEIRPTSEFMESSVLEILNSSGTIIRSEEIDLTKDYKLNTANLTNGTYFIRIANDKDVYIEKIIKL